MYIYKSFRFISILEGLSYIFLVFIAMPMKYLYSYMNILKFIGMIHGILFIIFVVLLIIFIKRYNFSRQKAIDYFVYSLSPFAFIFIEKDLKELKWNDEIK